MIAKYDFNDDGTITFTAGSFNSISGTEFTFDIGGEFKTKDGAQVY
jgi:hypothetical protein